MGGGLADVELDGAGGPLSFRWRREEAVALIALLTVHGR
jgi:hypothetical protein